MHIATVLTALLACSTAAALPLHTKAPSSMGEDTSAYPVSTDSKALYKREWYQLFTWPFEFFGVVDPPKIQMRNKKLKSQAKAPSSTEEATSADLVPTGSNALYSREFHAGGHDWTYMFLWPLDIFRVFDTQSHYYGENSPQPNTIQPKKKKTKSKGKLPQSGGG